MFTNIYIGKMTISLSRWSRKFNLVCKIFFELEVCISAKVSYFII